MATYGSLFSGVGGFDLGFDAAGYECLFQAEWDKYCRSVLNRHWPHVPKWGDVSKVNGAGLPPVDALIFGSPCQDLSTAGRRAGISGEKSVMFYEAMRLIGEMRDATNGEFPRVVVWENVAGALISNEGADFGAVLDEMAKAGALVIEWAVLDAQFFGVPQQRRRVFLVAVFHHSAAELCPGQLLPVSDSMSGDATSLRARRPNHDVEAEARAYERGETRSKSMMARGTHVVNTITANLYHNRSVTNQDVNNGHVVIEYGSEVNVRKMTPIECERLMGWPDDHTRWNADGSEQGDTHRYRQCGNGVVAPVAQWVAEQIRPLL